MKPFILRTARERSATFWRWGLAVHVSIVTTVATLAYLGRLGSVVTTIPHLDLLGHFLFIGPLAFFLDGVLEHRPLLRARSFPRLAPVAVALVAGAEEYLQRFSPRRSSSWSDFAADLLGICVFAWLSKRVADALRDADGAALEASES